MGSKVPATFVCVYPAHLWCFRIRMLCRAVGQGDQSGSMMSQLYLWTLAMHVSHLPVPDVMLLRHHCHRLVCCIEQLQAGCRCTSWNVHCQGSMHWQLTHECSYLWTCAWCQSCEALELYPNARRSNASCKWSCLSAAQWAWMGTGSKCCAASVTTSGCWSYQTVACSGWETVSANRMHSNAGAAAGTLKFWLVHRDVSICAGICDGCWW